MCGLATAVTIRRVIASLSIFSLECTEATTTSRRPSSSSDWSSAPVVEDVDLDAGQQPERRQLLVELGHDVELAQQPLRRQAVGDGQPRRVVGQHEVVVAEVAGGPGHLVDRAAAVGPVAVRVQVAAQRGPQVRTALGHRPVGRRLELVEVVRAPCPGRPALATAAVLAPTPLSSVRVPSRTRRSSSPSGSAASTSAAPR